MCALVLMGCGGSAAPQAAAGWGTTGAEASAEAPRESLDSMLGFLDEDEEGAPAVEGAQTSEASDAPWTTGPVGADAVPNELVAAWNGAENREWCALIAPTGVAGARARRSSFDGGWAVEFDKQGLPGVTQSGRACERCGRGAFGIAGTAMMVDDEDPTEAEETVLRDGSRVRIEVSEDENGEPSDSNGIVATIKVPGQDCVYQVWSYGGDAHLQELLRELRFVEDR
jgi:hypothetical protein